MIFDEGQFWICDKDSVQQHIQVDFDGGNREERQQPSENVQPITIEQQPAGSPHISTVETEDERPQRVKQRPAWMADFMVYGLPQYEDPHTYFALFSNCD